MTARAVGRPRIFYAFLIEFYRRSELKRIRRENEELSVLLFHTYKFCGFT